jgi:spore germination protein PC
MYHFQTYLQMLEQRMRTLEERSLAAEKELQELRTAFQQIKPIRIENINYKVQELVVRDLSGTLNIGLTALSDAEQLEKWMQQSKTEQETECRLENLQHPDNEGGM